MIEVQRVVSSRSLPNPALQAVDHLGRAAPSVARR